MTISDALLREYRALTEGTGFVDVSDRTKIELMGEDRTAFLHNFCTADIKRLGPGESCEAFICNVKGHTLGHVLVLCEETALWIDTVPGQGEKLAGHLDRYLIREKVVIADQTSNYAEFWVASKEARAVIERIGASLPVTAHRISPFAAETYLLRLPKEEQSRVTELLQFAKAVPCSAEALEMVRIENGFPWYGVDITEANLPQEVARDRQAISFTKGCYLGQETVARIDALGHVNNLLCGLEFEGDAVPPVGIEILADGKAVGRVTSACWSPKLGKPLALAYLRRTHATSAVKLASPLGAARVVVLPI